MERHGQPCKDLQAQPEQRGHKDPRVQLAPREQLVPLAPRIKVRYVVSGCSMSLWHIARAITQLRHVHPAFRKPEASQVLMVRNCGRARVTN